MGQAGNGRRGPSASVLVAAALLLGSATVSASAGAAPQGAPPPVVTASAADGSIVSGETCDGPRVTTTAGSLTVERPGSIAGTISVDVTYRGTLVAGTDYEPLPDPIVIPAGQSSTTLTVEAGRGGTVEMTVEPGAGYVVGDPATAFMTVAAITWNAECPPEETQTIALGTAPASLDLDGRFFDPGDAYFEIEGELPPGLTLDRVGDWTGTATRVGTYRFVARYTHGALSALELPVRIVVVPAGGPVAPPAAAPAAPITDRPIFTG